MKPTKVLSLLSFSEVWDRFSYYGLQATLLLYVIKYLGFSSPQAYLAYGVYTTFAFLMPVIGGAIGDHFINRKHCLQFGLVLYIIGNVLLIVFNKSLLFIGLSLITVGIGLFKPNNAAILAQITHHYKESPKKWFNLLYVGMNTGAVLGPLVYGLISSYGNWHLNYLVSAVLLLISLITVTKYLPNIDKRLFSKKYIFTGLGLALMLLLIWICYQNSLVFSIFAYCLLFGIVIKLVWILRAKDPASRRNLSILTILNIIGMCYFISAVQLGSTIIVYIDSYVNTTVFHYHIPATIFPIFPPLAIIIFSPFFIRLQERTKHLPLSMIIRYVAIGLFLGGLSFLLYILSMGSMSDAHRLILVIIACAILGLGELFVAPTLLTAVSYFVSERLQGTFMGIWYLLVALAAYIGSLLSRYNLSAKNTIATLPELHHLFGIIACISTLAAILLIALGRIYLITGKEL